jgi:hypothetical protein
MNYGEKYINNILLQFYTNFTKNYFYWKKFLYKTHYYKLKIISTEKNFYPKFEKNILFSQNNWKLFPPQIREKYSIFAHIIL